MNLIMKINIHRT